MPDTLGAPLYIRWLDNILALIKEVDNLLWVN